MATSLLWPMLLVFEQGVFQLKYPPEWLIIGTDKNKLNEPDSTKLITEIQVLRTEVDILHVRMRVFEIQLKELWCDKTQDEQ